MPTFSKPPLRVQGELPLWILPDGSTISCPYGQEGDVLWCREAWCFDVLDKMGRGEFKYKADFQENDLHPYQWKPSIHMPRNACRIRLEITEVRAEKLVDISEDDAIAEGVEPLFDEETRKKRYEFDLDPMPYLNYLWHGSHDITAKQASDWDYQYSSYTSARESYSSLWEKINGKGSWNDSVWVWAISFKRL